MNGCVYVVHALTTNYYKIGITTDLEKRLYGIRLTIPFFQIVVIAEHYHGEYKKIEGLLHELYADKRLNNSEWFELTSDELSTATMRTIDLIDSLGLNNHKPLDIYVFFADNPRGDDLRKTLNELHDKHGMSWRDIANLKRFDGFPAGSLCSYAGGWEPKTEKARRMFGLKVTEMISQVRDKATGQFIERSS